MGAHNGAKEGGRTSEREWEWELLEFSMPLAMTAAATKGGREGAGNAPLTAKKPRSVAAAVPAPDFKGQTSSFLPTED